MTQDVHAQLASAGLDVQGSLEIGKLVRCKVEGDKGSKRSGWYVLHELRLDNGETVLVGRYGNWKNGTGEQGLKVEFDAGGLSEDERARLKAEHEAARKKAAEEKQARAEEAAKRAARIWAKLPDSGTSEYLTRKGVKAWGLRFSRGSIVVPVRRVSGDLVGLQWIKPDGGKKFLTGTAKRGAFHLIGELPEDPRAPIAIAEGYATAATVYEVARDDDQLLVPAVAVAFDAGNLEPVAQALREVRPEAPLLFLADNDAWTEGNPGVSKAKVAADAVGNAAVFWPEFAGEKAA